MTARIAHRLAQERNSSPCARCLLRVELRVGRWHATEPGGLDRPVCDHCAQRDDPHGFEMVAAFRRMAKRAA